VRRGLVPVNPVTQLERSERPRVGRKRQPVLETAETERLINAALPSHRLVIATAVLSGLRPTELLGLRWENIDFANGYIKVRHQLGRDGLLKPSCFTKLAGFRARLT
jgi:integrase